METLTHDTATSKARNKFLPLPYGGGVAMALMPFSLDANENLGTNTHSAQFHYRDCKEYDSRPKIDRYIARRLLQVSSLHTHDLSFFNLVQKLSDSQVDLDDDFKAALNRVTSKIARRTPTKRRF